MLPEGTWDPTSPPENPIPAAGNVSISFRDINTELKNSPTAAISLNDYRCRMLAAKPTGAISLYDFYGKFCRAVYRPTAFNGVAGANGAAYDGGTITASFNAEAYTTTSTSASYGPGIGTYTFSGLPATPVTGTLRVRAAKAIVDDGGSVAPPSTLAAFLEYSVAGGAWTSVGLLTVNSTEFSVALNSVDPNTLSVRVYGASASGGNLKLGTDYSGHSVVNVWDILFTY
jgi:hypothetical protein